MSEPPITWNMSPEEKREYYADCARQEMETRRYDREQYEAHNQPTAWQRLFGINHLKYSPFKYDKR
ncbi:TPA: hypothetical protein HA253_02290 [Candidatus Woesearchaeota archaeon]|nr:hypothetical protein [Candidatus Woesearchaeota archaeon]